MTIFFLLGAVFFVLCRFANSFEVLLMGRLLVGVASGLTTSVVPMYLAELAPLQLRGSVATLVGMSIVFGVFIGQIFSLPQTLGSAGLWEFSFAFHSVFTIIGLAVYPWFPESPAYLFIVANDVDRAINGKFTVFFFCVNVDHKSQIKYLILELKKLRKHMDDSVHNEISLLKIEASQYRNNRSIWSVLIDRSMLLPIFVVFVLQAGQQLSGINIVSKSHVNSILDNLTMHI